MAPLDRLLRRNAKPKPPPSTPRGTSGRGHSNGFIVEDELNQSLVGAEGRKVFDRMWRTQS